MQQQNVISDYNNILSQKQMDNNFMIMGSDVARTLQSGSGDQGDFSGQATLTSAIGGTSYNAGKIGRATRQMKQANREVYAKGAASKRVKIDRKLVQSHDFAANAMNMGRTPIGA